MSQTETVEEALPDQSLNIKALQERALALWEVDQASALELGRALIAVRDAMQEHGAFAQWWRGAGLEENRVYYCIRKAEGKVKPALVPQRPFTITKDNLAPLLGVSPKSDGKSTATGIYLSANGTFATDGWLLTKVSLPAGAKAPDKGGMLPLDFASRLAKDLAGSVRPIAEITFDGDEVTGTTHEMATTAKLAPGQFPNVDGIYTKLEQDSVILSGSISAANLKRLAESAQAFCGDDTVDIRITDKFVHISATKSADATQVLDTLMVHSLRSPAGWRALRADAELGRSRVGMAQLQAEEILCDVELRGAA
jgi:hypothetical protein